MYVLGCAGLRLSLARLGWAGLGWAGPGWTGPAGLSSARHSLLGTEDRSTGYPILIAAIGRPTKDVILKYKNKTKKN